ncbi:MAG: hypothetical protein R2824_33385 [Saprospiraceae bacterium]
MPFPIQKMHLEAPSLYALISTWAETQMIISEKIAQIIGYGYARDVAEAFTLLVFDWEATIFLDRTGLMLPAGTYGLIHDGDTLLACREQQSFSIPDQPVTIEVISVPED